MLLMTGVIGSAAVQSQKAVISLTSQQILPFGYVEQYA